VLGTPDAFPQGKYFHESIGSVPVNEGESRRSNAWSELERVSRSPEVVDPGGVDAIVESIPIRAVELLSAAPDAPTFMRELDLRWDVTGEITIEAVSSCKGIHLTVQGSITVHCPAHGVLMPFDPLGCPLQGG
jgi:hypothetical protein